MWMMIYLKINSAKHKPGTILSILQTNKFNTLNSL